MCGIAGYVAFPRASVPDPRELDAATDALAHRGPDGRGTWRAPNGRVGLGHRRLSVIDPTPGGDQPMRSPCGRYTLVFNGEVYGFRRLRAELEREGARFGSESDTEVLLQALVRRGPDALERVHGMFAFAFHDAGRGTLLLARDRLGKKPLYVGVRDGLLAFGSELRALRAFAAFEDAELDLAATSLYLERGYVPAPHAILRDVVKLPAGHHVEIPCRRPPPSAEAVLDAAVRWYDLGHIATNALARRSQGEASSLRNLAARLDEAVAERMVADVPVGAFLSAGIDSALVVATMRRVSDAPVRTFTVRFAEASHDEADGAARIADHLGTEHRELLATPDDAVALVEDVGEVWDEPFADASQIPTLLLSRLVREHVTVALSGDGGDEALGGYGRYRRMAGFERFARVPTLVWDGIEAAPLALCDAGARAGRLVSSSRGTAALLSEASGDRIKKLARIMRHPDPDRRYRAMTAIWDENDAVLRTRGGSRASRTDPMPFQLEGVDRMMFRDAVGYLPDDILVKVDRASMSCGLEMRAPLLDHRFVAEAWAAPRSLCVRGGTGKVALRRLLAAHLPPALIDRPKTGFGVPMAAWLRGPLRPWADGVLRGIAPDGLFDRERILARWQEHLHGRRNWAERIWTVLVFETWARRWGIAR